LFASYAGVTAAQGSGAERKPVDELGRLNSNGASANFGNAEPAFNYNNAARKYLGIML
jgi:hypothetical protein